MQRFHRVLLVVNPVARTVSRPTLAVIEKALSADFKLEVVETVERGHATEMARQAAEDGIDLLVVFSGDGTINEALNGLVGTETALGVLPGGATNILVRALGLPTTPVEATGVLISRALANEVTKLNLGRADGRYFAVNCGAGVDAAAMRRLDAKFPKTKLRFDRAAFRAAAWELMVGYAGRRPDLEVRIDGEEPTPSLSVMVGRTDPYTYYKDRGLRMTPERRSTRDWTSCRCGSSSAGAFPGSPGRCSAPPATCTDATSTIGTMPREWSSPPTSRSQSRSTATPWGITLASRFSWHARPCWSSPEADLRETRRRARFLPPVSASGMGAGDPSPGSCRRAPFG